MVGNFSVRESTKAQRDYDRIDDFLFETTGDASASARIVHELAGFVGSLSRLPHQGTRLDDILPGPRLLPFEKASIAFSIDEVSRTVFELRLFYSGEDIPTALREINEP